MAAVTAAIVVLLTLSAGGCGGASVAAWPAAADPWDNQLSEAQQAAGWQRLFDGVTLSGWRSYRAASPAPAWQVLDGNLVLTAKGGGDLIYDQVWSDFELELDWWISRGGNSGVFILADEELDYVFVKAPEVQILDDARHQDNQVPSHLSGSLYDLIASPAAARKPAQQWNRLRIHYQQGRLQVWQNQVQTADITIGSPEWQRLLTASKFADWPFATLSKGLIGLQDHGDVVAFKNVFLRPLSDVPQPMQELTEVGDA